MEYCCGKYPGLTAESELAELAFDAAGNLLTRV